MTGPGPGPGPGRGPRAARGAPPFGTVLVANRGEIACRVLGTLRRLGVRSVAVFSDADADARHVALADVAVRLGPAPAARSYLDVEAVVAAAVRSGADAVHPGYGFLSESPALARACERAGLVLVGPRVRALEVMADKTAAKRLVAAHGVPVVPGTAEAGLDDDALRAAAADVGFPLLVKPAAGGGGKGMEVVRRAADLPAALASARRVAAAAFGDDDLLLERLLERPRHVEVQVLADAHGGVVHLGERECSLQRRHQKIVEEAPSPLLDAAARARMGEAACAVARAVDYLGAGTVELLVPADDPSTFHFIEMNTRLQVEHPVTEAVTGLDLVELQLRVAAGEPLPLAQEDVVLRGHAVEARLYAERPAAGFLPATGTVLALREPAGTGPGSARTGAPGSSGPGSPGEPVPAWRLDSGLRTGGVVTGDYDPMLAKAVAHGATRAEALDRLDALLAATVVLGVETNTAFLRHLLADDDVRAGRLDTGLVDRVVDAFLGDPDDGDPGDGDPGDGGPGDGGPGDGGPDDASDDRAVVAAALLVHAARRAAAAPAGPPTTGTLGPWAAADGWRAAGPPRPWTVRLRGPEREHVVAVVADATGTRVRVDDGPERPASLVPDGAGEPGGAGEAGGWRLTVDGLAEPVVAALDPTMPSGPPTMPSGAVPVPGRHRTAWSAWSAGPAGSAGGDVWVWRDGTTRRWSVPDRAVRDAVAAGGTGEAGRTADPDVRAAMPGTVVALPVPDGARVEAGTTVVVVEAMKMEHPLTAPHPGTLRLHVRPGDLARLGQVVAVVEPDTPDATPDPDDGPTPAAVVHPAPTGADTPGGPR